MSQTSIGVCIFDDTKSARDGWASVNGKTSYRVTGFHELASDKLWVTNLDFPDFKSLNLLRLKHLAQSQYFRTKLSLLQNEFGIDEPKEFARFVSQLFSRVARLGDIHLGIDPMKFNYRYTQAVSSKLDVPSLHSLPRGLNPNEVQLIIDHSTQENQAMTGVKKPERSSAVAFCYPRFTYARWLLSQPYPMDLTWKKDNLHKEWKVGVREGKTTKQTDDFIKMMENYILKSNKSIFLRISILSQEPTHRAFATFAAGSQSPRVWATYPEVLELMRYSELMIYESASVGAGVLQDVPCIDNPLYSNCMSAGLFLENYYCALMAPIDKRNTALGAYMRAYDRMACGRAAEAFHNAGFVVGSYSSGRIIVLIREGERERAEKLALKIGMIPPFPGEAS
ncbi:hypothetical protein RBE51_19685 [Pseudomonas taiwanensis]|uniref:hypothetical protein n=1 Tax=Pseudomonas taiwanensis TaxID=470150 RepID=UPI0028DEC0F0|nr:hypothetical protein [Pseudomonas taiwanensis]MDT8925014.1 hypothetical protein [Pseudomonas taiwanensis]